MKVLLLNGSAKPNGNTAQALEAAAAVLRADGIETELFQLGGDPIRDCIGCGQRTHSLLPRPGLLRRRLRLFPQARRQRGRRPPGRLLRQL